MRRFRFIHRGSGGPEELALELSGSRCVFERGAETEGAAVSRLPDGRLCLLFDDGRQVCGRVEPGEDGLVDVVTSGGHRTIAIAEPLRDRLAHSREAGAGESGEEEIRALMPGRVVEVQVAVGQQVAAGALILVLEAMKMQNEIRSSRAGRVLRIGVASGAAVDGGTVLAVIQSQET